MTKITLADLKAETGIGFGTSGVRGLVTDLTDKVIYCYTKAFVEYLKDIGDINFGKIAIAGDLRDSTDRILKTVCRTIIDCGYKPVFCGKIPTPAVANYGFRKGIPSIMVTGSHIPADRNGIKYNLSTREILKSDEKAITARTVVFDQTDFDFEMPEINKEAEEMYKNRFFNRFEKDFLKDKKIGVYQHSAVGRDLMVEILNYFGAEVVLLGRSEFFIPVDTELIDEDVKSKGKEWSKEYSLDAIISTDGDSDRPLIADENGNWLRSDILGIIVAKYWQVKTIVTAISCNTALEKTGWFDNIIRVKIGSPYTIEAMLGLENVIGYEANGGFIEKDLLTRDAFIVLLSVLAVAKNRKISEVFSELPKRYTSSGSLKGFPTEKSIKLVTEDKDKTIKVMENNFGEIETINELDGLRFYFTNGDIVHLRPSMNSPEFRNYTESDSEEKAMSLSQKAGDLIKSWL